MQPFTIITTLPDNGLNVNFNYITAETAEQALQTFVESNNGLETVITVVYGYVNKALEDDDIEEIDYWVPVKDV